MYLCTESRCPLILSHWRHIIPEFLKSKCCSSIANNCKICLRIQCSNGNILVKGTGAYYSKNSKRKANCRVKIAVAAVHLLFREIVLKAVKSSGWHYKKWNYPETVSVQTINSEESENKTTTTQTRRLTDTWRNIFRVKKSDQIKIHSHHGYFDSTASWQDTSLRCLISRAKSRH